MNKNNGISKVLSICLIIILFLFSSCTAINSKDSTSLNQKQNNNNMKQVQKSKYDQVIDESEINKKQIGEEKNNINKVDESKAKKQIVDKKDFYKIYKVSDDHDNVEFIIDFNNSKSIKIDRFGIAPYITKVTDEIVEIRFHVGNPADYVLYYNLKTSQLSKEFFNPTTTKNDLVVYMNENYNNNEITMVIQDIFDKSKYYKEIKRDFSPVAAACSDLEKAEFIDNNKLRITYLEGGNFTKKTEIISLNN